MSDLRVINPVADEDDESRDMILGVDNPKSVFNLVPGQLQRYMKVIPQDVWMMTPDEMEAEEKVRPMDAQLRVAFWLEYERAHRTNSQMRMTDIYKGICSRTLFANHVISNSFRLAYILTPPAEYRIVMQEMLDLGLKQLREFLREEHSYIDENGVRLVDAKVAAVKLKAVEMLSNRLQGMPVHRSMQITENFNRNITSSTPSSGGQPDFNSMKPEELKNFINQMRGQGTGQYAISAGGGLKDEVQGGARDCVRDQQDKS